MMRVGMGRQWLLAGLVVLWCGGLGAAAGGDQNRTDVWSYCLDIGELTDTNDSLAMYYCDDCEGAQDWVGDRVAGSPSYRLLPKVSGYYYPARGLHFRLNEEALSNVTVDEHGCPSHPAIIEVRFKREDVIEGGDARPWLEARIEWGAGSDPLDPSDYQKWWQVGPFPSRPESAVQNEEWITEKIFIEKSYFQAMRHILDDSTVPETYYFEFRLVHATQSAGVQVAESIPIDSITLRFLEPDDFNSERETDRAARGLTRTEATVGTAYGTSEYVVYAPHYLKKVYAKSAPETEEILGEEDALTAFEIAGEREPVTFVVHAAEDLQDVWVEVSDLVVPGSSPAQSISADDISVHRIAFLDWRWWYANYAWYGRQPVFLDDNDPVDVNRVDTWNQQYWLTVNVPADAAAGTYEGTITIHAKDSTGVALDDREVALVLRVVTLGDDLGEPDSIAYELTADPYVKNAYRLSADRDVAADDEAAHNLNIRKSVTVNVTVPTQYNGTYTIDDYSNLDAALAALAQRGMVPRHLRIAPSFFISSGAITLWDHCACNAQPYPYYYTCSAFDTMYKSMLQDLYNHIVSVLANQNLTVGPGGDVEDIGIFYVDEPYGTWNSDATYVSVQYRHRLVHEVAAGPGNYYLTTWTTCATDIGASRAGYRLTYQAAFGDGAVSTDRERVGTPAIAVSWTFTEAADIVFTVSDLSRPSAQTESYKELLVNNEQVWDEDDLGVTHLPVTVPYSAIAPHVKPGQDPVITFRVTAGSESAEEVNVYFVNDELREEGSVTAGTGWSSTFTADPAGLLGPLGPGIDEHVMNIIHVTEENIHYVRDLLGKTFSMYTTNPGTANVPTCNRFLHGFFASAVEAQGVYHYPYYGWGPQVWDDLEQKPSAWNTAGLIGSGSQQLAHPSWDDKMYDSIIFETLREGVEDSRVVKALKGAIAAAPPGLSVTAASAQAYLDMVLARIDRNYYSAYYGSVSGQPVEWHLDRSREMVADLAADPSGTSDDYGVFDDIRRQLIYYTLILTEQSLDCNTNYIPDDFDIADCDGAAWCLDCNTNSIPDDCELAGNDCNTNSVPDECDIAAQTSLDCNLNGVPDECDIVRSNPSDPWSATSLDTNQNGIPDECEPVCLGNSDGSAGSPLLTPADRSALVAACGNNVDAWLAVVGSPSPCTFWNNDLDGDWDVDTNDLSIFDAAYNARSRGCLGACCYDFGGVPSCSMLDYGQCARKADSTFYLGERCIDICDRCDHVGCP